jgi:uncharacterized heparinase superfamily protein
MDRRTALQMVAAMITAWKGERLMNERQDARQALTLSDFQPKAIRFHIDPKIKLEISFGDEVIEIPQDELIAALRRKE